jgi:hypothetical protein
MRLCGCFNQLWSIYLQSPTFILNSKIIEIKCIWNLYSSNCLHYHSASGCKHGKVDQKSAPLYDNHDFLGQTPISSSKMLFKIDYFS